jgi:hypothetical protein
MHEGLITKVGKSFWIGELSQLIRNQHRHKIFMFKSGEFNLSEVYNNSEIGLSYRKMEQELLDFGFHISYTPLSQFEPLAQQWDHQKQWPYGLIFSSISTHAFTGFTRYFSNHSDRTTFDYPPVLLELNSGDYHEIPKRIQILHYGNIDTTRAKTMAQFITNKGYRKLSFIFTDDSEAHPNPTWFIGRLLAFLKVLPVLQSFNYSMSYNILILSRHKKFSVDLVVDTIRTGFTPERIQAIFDKYEPSDRNSLLQNISVYYNTHSLFENLKPGLWHVSNTQLAIEAKQWCAQKNISIPGSVSLTTEGIDTRLMEHDISSVMIDWANTGYRMAHSLIHDITPPLSRKGFLKPRAVMAERGST